MVIIAQNVEDNILIISLFIYLNITACHLVKHEQSYVHLLIV